ncbi:L-asparaginase [Citrobacter portucalensis]|nr:L-asparaginase [Citrobacter portucalensis]RHH47124.1 L-asparaginase [Citrobacter portucalensis]
MLASLIPGCARNPHVLCVRSGCCAQAVNNLPTPLTPDLLAV